VLVFKKIRVEQVCKNIVKLFPDVLNGHVTAEKQLSWPSRLPV